MSDVAPEIRQTVTMLWLDGMRVEDLARIFRLTADEVDEIIFGMHGVESDSSVTP